MKNTTHPLEGLPALLVSAALAFICCISFSVGSSVAVERPDSAGIRDELKSAASNINVTFEASSKSLATALNQMIGNEIYRGSTKTGGITVDIVRNGPIALTAADNSLYFTVPVTMSLRYAGFQTPAFSSGLKFKLIPRITPDWKLNAEISYMGLSDLVAEDMRIGILSIKPRSVIEGVTQPLQKAMSHLVNKKINEKYPLKAEMEKIWFAAQRPVLLDKNYRAWLKITPQEMILYPLCAVRDQVKLTLGLKSVAEVVVGPEPALVAPVPLPDLKLGANSDSTFRIFLNTDIFYKDIVDVSAPLLLNRELGSDGKSIVLKKLDIYRSGDKLAVKVDAAGSFDGIFNLTCRPSFNPQSNVFSVEDVDFDMETQGFLLKAAAWLLHSKIRNTIQEKINMNLTQRMQQVLETARKAVDQVRLTDHILLKGHVKDVALHGVAVQKDRISIQVYANGESTINLQ